MNGNDFASVFSALFSKAGVFCLWTTFIVGGLLRWVANARVKGQVRFLSAYDRSLLSLKDTPSLSQSDLRDKSENYFRVYYPSKGGGRFLRTIDRLLGGETTSWTLIDRVVHMAFDHRGGAPVERARSVLASTDSFTHFLRFFSLGAFHRVGAATPALLLILGAIGTYTGFLTALPFLNPSDISDARALTTTLQDTLARMSSYAGYSILGSLLAFASVLANSIWDAERTYQSATNRLAHIVEFLSGLERSNAGQGISQNGGVGGTSGSNASRGRKSGLKSAPAPETFSDESAEEETPAAATAQAEAEYAVPEPVEKSPVARRQRAEVVKAEADWGPLPLSAVPSPKKKPIRVEAADIPKPETVRSDDDVVAEEVTPEISTPQPLRHTGESSPRNTAPEPMFEAEAPAPTPASSPALAAAAVSAPVTDSAFQFHENAFPSDWDDQIRGLKTQLDAMQPRPAEAPAPAPEIPVAPPVPQEIPYDENLERTIVGVPQLADTRHEAAAPMRPEFVAAPLAPLPEPHDSPTEAELLNMMVPKEWSTQRPADTMAKTIPDDFDMPAAPAPAPQRPMAAAPAPVSSIPLAPVAPPTPSLTAAEQDRLAILEHRMDKVLLYLSKAAEDLKLEFSIPSL